jgi:membrane protein implicated in regulation of membrane protease activity
MTRSRSEREEEGFGWKFWAVVFGLCVAAALGGVILAILFGWAVASWGLIGMFLVLSVILIAFGYAYDRREKRRRRQLA